MRAAAFVLTFALVMTGASVSAETFTSAYDPQPGERFELTIDKCTANAGAAEECARSIYLEEVLEDSPNGATRVRYTMQSMQRLGRENTAEEQHGFDLLARNMVLLFHTDEAGVPILIENRQAILDLTMAMIPPDNADARDRMNALLSGMSDEAFAGMFGKDFAPPSIFQAIEIEVGHPVTGSVSLPFPLDETQSIEANATLTLHAIDRTAGVARASFRQAVDPASASAAVRAFLETMAQETIVPALLATIQIERSDEINAVIDLASGRVMQLEMSTRSGVSSGVEDRIRTERLTMTRRMLPNG